MALPDSLRITDVSLTVFRLAGLAPVTYTRQSTPASGEAHLGLVTVATDAGIVGHAFLGSSFRPVDIDARALIDVLKPRLLGKNPLDREQLVQSTNSQARAVMLRNIGALDVALWDIAGKVAGLPIHRLIGTAKIGLPAYASSSTLPSIEAYEAQAHGDRVLATLGMTYFRSAIPAQDLRRTLVVPLQETARRIEESVIGLTRAGATGMDATG